MAYSLEGTMKTTNERKLIWSIAVTIVILIAEVIGGVVSNSLALLSDAGHVLTDVFALCISLVAQLIMHRPSNHRATYGYQRIGILAALINGATLVIISVFIFVESYQRFLAPPEIHSGIMLVVAAGGLLGNLVMVWILGGGHKDLNVKSAWLHVLGDVLTSVGVIIAGLFIKFWGWRLADPVASAIVGVIIIIGGFKVMKEALWIFLELSPIGFHAEEISQAICGMEGVLGVHDVHVWSIGHGIPAFSAHVLIPDRKISETDALRGEIEHKLSEIGIRHTVLQMECAECRANGLYCQIGGVEEPHHHHH
jgi:cobalt-zinc-cadmium efflux system protein